MVNEKNEFKEGNVITITHQSPIQHEPIADGYKRICCCGGDWCGHDAICGGCGKYKDVPISDLKNEESN